MQTDASGSGEIRRATVSEKAADEAYDMFLEHVRLEGGRRRDEALKRDSLLEAIYAPLRAVIRGDSHAMSAVAQLRQFSEARRKEFVDSFEAGLRRHLTDAMFDMQPRALPGLSVFGLPYDFEWSVPNSEFTFAATDRNAGTLHAFAVGGVDVQRIESGAGLGFALTTPSTVRVRVSAYMSIHFDWSAVVIEGLYTRVDGAGLIIVFRDDGAVVLHSKAVLFDQFFQAGAWEGHDDTYIGYTSAAHPEFLMEAGRTYFAWHYGIVGAVGNGDPAGSAIDCRLPFVFVAPV